MDTHVLEGTLDEIRRQLGDLTVSPDERVRVIIEEAPPLPVAPRIRRGIALLPVKCPGQVITTEFVQSLLDAE